MKNICTIISTISLITLITTLTITALNKRKNPPKSIYKIEKLNIIFTVIFIISLVVTYFVPNNDLSNDNNTTTFKQQPLNKETIDKMQKEIKTLMESADNNKIKTTLLNEAEHINLMTSAINENKNKKSDLKIIVDKCALLSKEGQYRLSEMQKYIKDTNLKNSAKYIENAYSHYREAMIYAFRNAENPNKQTENKYMENLNKAKDLCQSAKSNLK